MVDVLQISLCPDVYTTYVNRLQAHTRRSALPCRRLLSRWCKPGGPKARCGVSARPALPRMGGRDGRGLPAASGRGAGLRPGPAGGRAPGRSRPPLGAGSRRRGFGQSPGLGAPCRGNTWGAAQGEGKHGPRWPGRTRSSSLGTRREGSGAGPSGQAVGGGRRGWPRSSLAPRPGGARRVPFRRGQRSGLAAAAPARQQQVCGGGDGHGAGTRSCSSPDIPVRRCRYGRSHAAEPWLRMCWRR